MAASSIGLPLQRAELSADLTQEVLDPGQVRLGGRQAPLGTLLAAAVLQDPGSLLDDEPALLRAGVEDTVDVALGDDHVLLAAHTGVRQQLLDVEQAARHAVDRVLAVARAEQQARDRDLGEVDRQLPCGVVDRERDLRPTQRRALGAAGEDDVVHLLGPHRRGGLGTEHPADRVDHVGLARSVRPDDHGHARLERQLGGVREGLEALDLECLEEHVAPAVVAVDGGRPGHARRVRPGSVRSSTCSRCRSGPSRWVPGLGGSSLRPACRR